MFSFYILGFFQLKGGCRHPCFHCQHNAPGPRWHGRICRLYCESTATSPTAKSLASNSLTLDALIFVVLPGNPDSDTYNVRAVCFLLTHPHVIEGPLAR
jgi:hypothetical protein